jgi:hypothetical protein
MRIVPGFVSTAPPIARIAVLASHGFTNRPVAAPAEIAGPWRWTTIVYPKGQAGAGFFSTSSSPFSFRTATLGCVQDYADQNKHDRNNRVGYGEGQEERSYRA